MSWNNVKSVIYIYSAPLAAFLIFALSLLQPALHIELQQQVNIPIHLSMFLAGIIGGGIGTIVAIVKKIYEGQNIDVIKRADDLQHELKIQSLNRDLSEQRIMLNSAQYNEDWIKANMKVEHLEKILYSMKEKRGIEKIEKIINTEE